MSTFLWGLVLANAPFSPKYHRKCPDRRQGRNLKFKSEGPVVYLCSINQCPIDIILKIAEYLQMNDLCAFLRTSRDFYAVIAIPFYNRAIDYRCTPLVPSVIEWAAWRNQPTLTQKFQTPRRRRAFSTESKNNSLGIAAYRGHSSTIVPLLELGAEISSTNHVYRPRLASLVIKYTPLHYAAQHGHLTAVEVLLDHARGFGSCEF